MSRLRRRIIFCLVVWMVMVIAAWFWTARGIAVQQLQVIDILK